MYSIALFVNLCGIFMICCWFLLEQDAQGGDGGEVVCVAARQWMTHSNPGEITRIMRMSSSARKWRSKRAACLIKVYHTVHSLLPLPLPLLLLLLLLFRYEYWWYRYCLMYCLVGSNDVGCIIYLFLRFILIQNLFSASFAGVSLFCLLLAAAHWTHCC